MAFRMLEKVEGVLYQARRGCKAGIGPRETKSRQYDGINFQTANGRSFRVVNVTLRMRSIGSIDNLSTIFLFTSLETHMLKSKLIKGLLGVAAVALCGAFTAQAQTVKPPVTGEPNDHTSPGAIAQPAGKMKPMSPGMNTGVVPPKVGEANDHTSANAVERPAPKVKAMKTKMKKAKVKEPVTGEANDHSSNGGTTEAAKAAKAAKAASM